MKNLSKLVVLVLLVVSTLPLGCTRSTQPATDAANAALQPGARPFAFDYQRATEVLIAHWTRETGANWTARAEKIPGNETGDSEKWVLRSATDLALADNIADTSSIEHLLDSLSALQVERVPERPDAESQGLNPPLFAIRWKTGPTQEFEIKIGAPFRAPGARAGNYALVRRGEETPRTLIVTGSALKILEHLESLNALRHRAWGIEHVDDVDEVEFRKAGKPALYAQREGDDWTDRDHKPLAGPDTTATLEKLLHSPIETFIEAPEAVSKAKGELASSKNAVEIVLKDRDGNASVLLAGESTERKILATHSRRPNAVFVLSSGSLDPAQAFLKTPSARTPRK